MNDDNIKPLTPDEAAVTDYLSGVLKQLPPVVGNASEDRARLEELMQVRNEVGEASIVAPEMTTTFNDVIRRAGKTSVVGALLDAMSSRWGFRLTAAAAVFIVFVSGTVVTSPNLLSHSIATGGARPEAQVADNTRLKPDKNVAAKRGPVAMDSGHYNDLWHAEPTAAESAPVASAPLAEGNTKAAWGSTMIRKGSLGLRHENPAEIQRKITDELTVYGGMIVNLNRSGVGESTSISMEVTVPSEKYGKFVSTLSSFGEVISQNESAQEAIGEIVDNEASLAESRDYLKRLDALAEKAGNSIDETRRLEGERRQVRRDIERYQRALDKLKERTSMATLNVSISTKRPEAVVVAPLTPFQRAINDGLDGLTRLAAGLVQILLVTLPLSIPMVVFLLVLLRRRKRVPYGQ